MPHDYEQRRLRLPHPDRDSRGAHGRHPRRDPAVVSAEVRRMPHVLGGWCVVPNLVQRGLRIACIGGIYSNYRALVATLADIDRRGVDATYFLGDLGAFGP